MTSAIDRRSRAGTVHRATANVSTRRTSPSDHGDDDERSGAARGDGCPSKRLWGRALRGAGDDPGNGAGGALTVRPVWGHELRARMPVLDQRSVEPIFSSECGVVRHDDLERTAEARSHAIGEAHHRSDRLPIHVPNCGVEVGDVLREERQARLVEHNETRDWSILAREMLVEGQMGDEVVADVVGARAHLG